MRAAPTTSAPEGGPRARRMGARPRVADFLADAVAAALLWFALLAPNRPGHLTAMDLVRIPVEGLAVAVLVLALSRRTTRAAVGVAVGVGVPLGVLSVLKVLELGFFGVLDRPFNLVTDHGHLRSAADALVSSFGAALGTGAVAGAVLLTMVLLIGVPLSVRRLARRVQRRPRESLIAVVTLALLWSAAAVSGSQVAPREPVAAAEAVRFAVREVRGTARALQEQRVFDAALGADAFHAPGSADLAGLRGKDVLFVFVESYGRVAVEGRGSATVQGLLDAGSRRLDASGFEARSAYLTSPTFGGLSWLAHATLQSGVWVDNQWRYERLLSGHRTSLASAFGRSGWRTAAVLPADRRPWPEGRAYYGFDQIYDSTDLGYAGPGFGFSSMPDQYTLQAFQRLEGGRSSRAPLMAEIDLTSSHGPWAPVPTMVGWEQLGDGSVFNGIHNRAESAAALWSRRDRVPGAYRASIEYSLTALLSFVERYGSDDLVVILLGDHQPSTIVSGSGSNRDVPITVVARDPKVIARISAWGWQDGLRPGTRAPVWRMDAFRDRFLAAYSGPTARGPAREGR